MQNLRSFYRLFWPSALLVSLESVEALRSVQALRLTFQDASLAEKAKDLPLLISFSFILSIIFPLSLTLFAYFRMERLLKETALRRLWLIIALGFTVLKALEARFTSPIFILILVLHLVLCGLLLSLKDPERSHTHEEISSNH